MKPALQFRIIFLSLVVVLAMSIPSALFAQPSEVTTTVTASHNAGLSLGRDCWFTKCQSYNASGSNGQIDEIMATSPNITTLHIALEGGATQDFPIRANQVEIFKIPLAWEVTTSGVVEMKAIHVWSDDADVCVYLFCFNPSTSEGMLVLPTIDWGSDYTVAAYAGVYENSFDYPSEYAVISDQDNTLVTSIPTADIRKTGEPDSVLHSKNVLFADDLNRGFCIQYVSVLAQNCTDYDFTGTIVKSNKPVGIVGASQCPEIPCDYPTCDYVTEMTPPRRTWVDQYFTMPTQARGQINGDTFLIIGSQDGQTVYIDDPKQGPNVVFCQVNNNQPYWFDAVQNPQRFWSNAPFEIMQYENSSSWDQSSIGDAAMTSIEGLEQYTSRVVFQTPTPTGLPYDFTNYLNVICPAGVGAHTTLDGLPLSSYKGASKVLFYSTEYEGYLIASLNPGTKILQCDTSNPANVVGAYIYGYGSYDSYFWPGSMGSKTFNNQDTFPPIAMSSGSCFCTHVRVSDDTHPADTKIMAMNIDTLGNMTYAPDTNYISGSVMDSTYYDVCVIDSTKSAYARVSVYDYAGNVTHVTSTYTPQTAILEPLITNFGSGNLGGPAKLDSVAIKNTGLRGFELTTLKLENGHQGFTIVPPIPSGMIPVGDSVKVYLNFIPVVPGDGVDTLIAGDDCVLFSSELVANGGRPDFNVLTYEFGCIPVDSSISNYRASVLTNPFSKPITIDSIWVDDTAEFHFTGTVPLLIASNSNAYASFRFSPDSALEHIATLAHFEDKKDSIIHTDSLIGCSYIPASVAESPANPIDLQDWLSGKNPSDILLLPAHPNPVLTTTSDVVITIGLRRSGEASLKLFDLTGKEVSTLLETRNEAPGVSDLHFNSSALPAGTYFYQLDALGQSVSGRFVIAR